jgi:uncharacterized protein (TIGR01777 family)
VAEKTFTFTTRIQRPAAEVFAWHERPGALARLCPPWERIRIVHASGGIRDGARVTVRNKIGPLWMEWHVGHRDFIEGKQFRDVQLRGPFSKWEHLHRVQPDGPDACWLTDEITYRLPGGSVGAALGGSYTERTLSRLFTWRHAVTKMDVELVNRYGANQPQRVLIGGSSGLIGSALVPFLQTQGHTVIRLERRPTSRADEVFWNPAAGEVNAAAIGEIDAIINLSGENVGAGRWTAERRDAIMRSRTNATRTLVDMIKTLRRKPRVFVSASAVGLYGNRGDELLSEGSEPGHGFLSDVCRAWDAEVGGAEALGVRTALLRLGVVLSPAGGALGKLYPLFLAGLGGRVGGGRQWMSWVTIDEVVGAFYHAILDERCRGPLNVVTPHPVTNAEFAATLGRVLRRPAVFPVPSAVLRALFGEMADATLLASTRAVPQRLLETGYAFRHPTLEAALRHVLGRFSGAVTQV